MSELMLLAQSSGTFWMPEQASTTAHRVDWLFYFIFWISLVFFVLIAGLMFYFMWRYRRRMERQPVGTATHNTALELTWSIIPTILLIPMFWWGMVDFLDARTPPQNTYDINVRAVQWNWEFNYPNGHSDNVLNIPGNQPVKLIMQSDDVIHSLYIPAFRVKRDVVPGRYSYLWFEARHEGNEPLEYPLFCAEYCGTSHSDMITKVVVHPDRAAFDTWLENANPLSEKNLSPEEFELWKKDPEALLAQRPDLKGRLLPPAEMGRQLYQKKGCFQCHSVTKDAPPMNGPTWWGLFGHSVSFTDGSSIPAADENYIRESIVKPNEKVVAGYNAIMPLPRVSDREIDALIAYIKTLKDE